MMPMYHYIIVVAISVVTTLAVLGVWFGIGNLIDRYRARKKKEELTVNPARFVRREVAAKEARFRKGPKGHAVVRDAHVSQSRQTWDAEEE